MNVIPIKPFVSAGEVFLHEDGQSFEMAPISFFQLRNGLSVLRRIPQRGADDPRRRNAYWFTEEGDFDGPECSVPADSCVLDAIGKALDESKNNRNQPPETAYFQEGSRGWEAETVIWPRRREDA